MLTLVWLIFWWLKDTPPVQFSDGLNDWAVLLIVFIALDLSGWNR